MINSALHGLGKVVDAAAQQEPIRSPTLMPIVGDLQQRVRGMQLAVPALVFEATSHHLTRDEATRSRVASSDRMGFAAGRNRHSKVRSQRFTYRSRKIEEWEKRG